MWRAFFPFQLHFLFAEFSSRKSSFLCTTNACICIYIIFYYVLAKLLFSYDKYMQSLSYLALIFKILTLPWKQRWIVPAKVSTSFMCHINDFLKGSSVPVSVSLFHSDCNSGKAHSMGRRSTEDLLKSQGWVKLIAFIINIPIFKYWLSKNSGWIKSDSALFLDNNF